MQSKAATVQQYLSELPADRRDAIEAVRQVILENLDPIFKEGMQYGMIGYHVPHSIYPAGYHCDTRQPLPFICLASQKNYMSLYLGCVYGNPEMERWFTEAWKRSGRKLDMGKSCLRFRKLEDLALEVIAECIRRVPAREFIQFYESVLRTTLRRSRAKASSPSASPGKRKSPARAKSAKRGNR